MFEKIAASCGGEVNPEVSKTGLLTLECSFRRLSNKIEKRRKMGIPCFICNSLFLRLEFIKFPEGLARCYRTKKIFPTSLSPVSRLSLIAAMEFSDFLILKILRKFG